MLIGEAVKAVPKTKAKTDAFSSGTLGASFDVAQVHALCAHFGASYESVDRILEFDGGFEFNRTYDRFTRCCRIGTRRN